MTTVFKSIEIKFEVSDSCIDFYVNDNFAGDFTLEEFDGYLTITPGTVDLEAIGYSRMGIYSFVIDTILNGDLNDAIESEIEVRSIEFKSVLRTEAACKFWQSRGFNVEYDEEEHDAGEQEEIVIEIDC